MLLAGRSAERTRPVVDAITSAGGRAEFVALDLGDLASVRACADAFLERAEPLTLLVNNAGLAGARGVTKDGFELAFGTNAHTTGFREYCVSKLANVLFTRELALRFPSGVHAYALHPGGVATDVWRRVPWGLRHVVKLFLLTTEEGARTTLYCATSDEVRHHNGLYYDRCKPREVSAHARDAALARELWERSAAWTGLPV